MRRLQGAPLLGSGCAQHEEHKYRWYCALRSATKCPTEHKAAGQQRYCHSFVVYNIIYWRQNHQFNKKISLISLISVGHVGNMCTIVASWNLSKLPLEAVWKKKNGFVMKPNQDIWPKTSVRNRNEQVLIFFKEMLKYLAIKIRLYPSRREAPNWPWRQWCDDISAYITELFHTNTCIHMRAHVWVTQA